MYLRRSAIVLLALPAALLVLSAFPPASEASVGVGVQAGPVRLSSPAHPGGSYALPPVYVVNTGTQDESVKIRVERLSHGPGRIVPPAWIRVTGPAVQLGPHQAARIPLELVVPAGGRPGQYLSDVVAVGSAAISAGAANLGVAAATKLEFDLRPGLAAGPSSFVPAATFWTLAGILLLALAVLGFRKSGIRIRIERNAADRAAVDR